jgi:hypothetical protein
MSHKYQDGKLLPYLVTKKYEDFPSYYVLKFLFDNKITIIDKREDITHENSNLYVFFKKDNVNGVLFFNVSSDHLMKLKITYKDYNKIIKTRIIENIIQNLKEALEMTHE